MSQSMRYVASVPLETRMPLRASDPDVRSISRLPGFVRLDPDFAKRGRYVLAFEVEAGSTRDAKDATDELFLEYANAMGRYGPRMLAEAAPEAR